MPIPLQCAECDQSFKVKDDLAGKRIKCPGCKKPIHVPAGKTNHRDSASSRSPPGGFQSRNYEPHEEAFDEPKKGWPRALKVGASIGIALGLIIFAVTFMANENVGGAVKMPIPVRLLGALCTGAPGYLFAGVFCEWDFFLRDQRARKLQGKLGQKGAQAVYCSLGLFILVLCLAMQLTTLIIYGTG